MTAAASIRLADYTPWAFELPSIVLDVHVQDNEREFKSPRRVVRQTYRSSCSHDLTTRGPNDPDGRSSKPGRFSQGAGHQAVNEIKTEEKRLI